MRRFLAGLFCWSVFVSPLFSQGSFQKEEVLSARKRAKEAPSNREHCSKLGFPASLSDNRCFEIYPDATITWGKGFSSGRAKVVIQGKVGFIDTAGKLVIPARYVDAGRFREGLAPFEASNGKWGFIDISGTTVIRPTFDWAISFSEGLALVQIRNLWGYIDRTGKLVIKPQFERAESFVEGVAAVYYYDKDLVWTTHSRQKGKWFGRFIDKSGNWSIGKAFDGIHRGFDGGMAIVSKNVGYKNGVLSETVVIDRKGRELWELGSPSIHWFADNAIVVEVDRRSNGRSLYNYRDRSGKLLCESNFEDAGDFSEGRASVRVGDKYGFINKVCELVIPPKFSSAGTFSEGLASASEDGTRTGFLSEDGNWVIKPEFRWVSGFSEGFALVADGNLTGYIDTKGEFIWKPTK